MESQPNFPCEHLINFRLLLNAYLSKQQEFVHSDKCRIYNLLCVVKEHFYENTGMTKRKVMKITN